jgi:hypothetical protein
MDPLLANIDLNSKPYAGTEHDTNKSATSDRYEQASPSITRLLPESISSVVAQTFRASVH